MVGLHSRLSRSFTLRNTSKKKIPNTPDPVSYLSVKDTYQFVIWNNRIICAQKSIWEKSIWDAVSLVVCF